jgi:hypothetical protein
MYKKIILLAVSIVVTIGIGYWVYCSQKEVEQEVFILDPENCTYVIEGKATTLIDGYSEEEIVSGSASKTVTRYFGNEASGDFNNDGISDVAFLMSQDYDGSGTFYYVAVALGGNNKCNGTNAILLGDRIAPQTINFMDGEIIVNYAERKPDEPMTASPSIGVSKYFRISEGQLVGVEK